MGVPPNRPFSWDFPLKTIHFGVPQLMETPKYRTRSLICQDTGRAFPMSHAGCGWPARDLEMMAMFKNVPENSPTDGVKISAAKIDT
jgi:hypothetical protein